MREVIGDLWTVPSQAVVIPTNGQTNRSGYAILGAGVALEARRRYPKLRGDLGVHLIRAGNHVFLFRFPEGRVFTFPTKHHYRQRADLDLIRQSAEELRRLAGLHALGYVALPRVGCGLGALSWDDVRPVLAEHLDDRFIVVCRKDEGR